MDSFIVAVRTVRNINKPDTFFNGISDAKIHFFNGIFDAKIHFFNGIIELFYIFSTE